MTTIKTFVQKFTNDWSMNLAGMLAYSLITTIFPILLAILTGASIVLGLLSKPAFDNVVKGIKGALPASLNNVINISDVLKSLPHLSGLLAVISVVGLIWAGSNLFTNMENAFSIVFRTRDRDFLPQRLMATGMVLILAVLLPLSLVASSLVTAGSSAFQKALPAPLGIVLTIVGPLTALAILWALFLAIYIVVPNIKVPFRDAWRGALAASVAFAVFNLVFPIYFKLFLSGNSKYGPVAASALLLIVWLWFFALITMIGAQINAVAMGIRPTRYDLARTLCIDYHEHTAPETPQTPAEYGRAAEKRTGGERKPRSGAGSSAGRALAAPLHMAALAGWLVARPFMRQKATASHDVALTAQTDERGHTHHDQRHGGSPAAR